MNIKRVYGYVRVSTGSQAEKGYGLETQREAIQKYCSDNNLELIEIFEDAGISGTEAVENEGDEIISKRAGLIQLLAALNAESFVAVMNTSRLWRSDIAKVLIRREIERKCSEVISIEQPQYSIYAKDPSERLISGMFELLDEYERLSISLKLATGRTTKAKRGDKPAGALPYGYTYADDKKSVVVVDAESHIVRKIFNAAQSGQSIKHIVDSLNADLLTTRQGKAWTKATVHGMLRNTFYTGVLTHQETSIQGNHTAIISKVQFGKVKSKLMKKNRRTKYTISI